MTNFDEGAREWDTPERQDRAVRVARVIRESVPLTPRTRMIELGAGTGLLGLELAANVGELVLAEPSRGMLGVAREKLAGGRFPNVSAAAFDLLTDAAPGGPFDVAVSLLMLHHLPDTRYALSAVRDLVRPGGRIALADLDAEDGSFHGPAAEGIHHQGFDREELAGLARSVGFTEVSVRTATELERDGRMYPVFLLLGRRPRAMRLLRMPLQPAPRRDNAGGSDREPCTSRRRHFTPPAKRPRT